VARAADEKPLHILFVGNSLTYVGNLPAVLESLASSNGKSLQADMIVKGGATLTQWLDRRAVRRAIKKKHYDAVVLQERGGDFACGFGPQVCKDSRHALHALAALVHGAGAEPILLGTYQPGIEGSASIERAEAAAARSDKVPYIAVSKRWLQGRKQFPHANWNWTDGMHPGHDLVLLEAVLLYQQLYGDLPEARPLEVRAPMFNPGSKFAPPAPLSLPLLPEVSPAGRCDYSRDEVVNAIELAGMQEPATPATTPEDWRCCAATSRAHGFIYPAAVARGRAQSTGRLQRPFPITEGESA